MIRIKVLKLKDVLFGGGDGVILAVLIIVLLVQAFSGARASAPTEAQVTWSEDLPQAGSSPRGPYPGATPTGRRRGQAV